MRMRFPKIFEEDAYTHCDIPCGIYDPHGAQMAAHTIIRMNQLLLEIDRSDETKAEHDIARITHVKEEHGGKIEEELGTLENDYFKPEHYKAYPKLRELLSAGVKLSIQTRAHIDTESADELLQTVMKIAEIFYKSKGLESVRVKAPYPTGLDIVVPAPQRGEQK